MSNIANMSAVRSQVKILHVMLMVQVIGEEVQRSKPEKFTDFLLKVRGMLVSDKLVPVTRAVLLHVLELHLLRWPSLLPDKTAEWYAGLLGARVMVRRQQTAAASSSLATTRTANGHAKVKEVGPVHQ